MNHVRNPFLIIVAGTATGLYAVTHGHPLAAVGIAIATFTLALSAIGNENKLPSGSAVGIIGLVATVISLISSPGVATVILGFATVGLAFALSGNTANHRAAAI